MFRKNTRSLQIPGKRNGRSLPSIPEFNTADEPTGEKTTDQTAEISSYSAASWSGSTGEPVDLAGGEKREAPLLVGGCDARRHQGIALVPVLGNAHCVHQGSFLCDTMGRGRRQGRKCQVSRVVLFIYLFFSPAAPLNKHSLATARGNGGAYLRGKHVAQTAGGIIRTG